MQLLAWCPHLFERGLGGGRARRLKLGLHFGSLCIEYGLDLGLLRVRQIEQGRQPIELVCRVGWAARPIRRRLRNGYAGRTKQDERKKPGFHVGLPSVFFMRCGRVQHVTYTFQRPFDLTDTVVAEVQSGGNQSLKTVKRLRQRVRREREMT
jgi:hypothetical protein